MSLTSTTLVVGAATIAATLAGTVASAVAQPAAEDDRFFVEKSAEEGKEDKSLWFGSLTSTTFYHRETGSISLPFPGGQVGAESASPVNRLFTDMRAQIDGKRIAGPAWDFRLDARARVQPSGNFQSGTFGGNEYDVREMYVRREGVRSTIFFGRQIIPELAAIKIDGLRVVYAGETQWDYIGFAGLYPTRGSRSVLDDYPKATPLDPMGTPKRLMPVTVGGGGAYRYKSAWGGIGAVGILPLADDATTGTLEKPRVFVTSNGYWRRSGKMDVFHYAVVDVDSASGSGLNTAILGVNYKFSQTLRANASVHHVDTETLNIHAQERLEEPDLGVNALVQNNIEIQRIAAQAARVGLSAGFKQNRFEVSTNATLRQRPEIELNRNDGMTVEFAQARGAELMLSVLDRQSYKGFRLRGAFHRMFGFGDVNLHRSKSYVVRLGGSHEIKGGKGEFEFDVAYLRARDENRGRDCNIAELETCFGSAEARTYSLGGTVYYRFKKEWFALGSLSLASQSIESLTATAVVEQPNIILATVFGRLAYRF